MNLYPENLTNFHNVHVSSLQKSVFLNLYAQAHVWIDKTEWLMSISKFHLWNSVYCIYFQRSKLFNFVHGILPHATF